MKNYYALLAALLMSFTINSQIIDIPDANFKNALVNTPCVQIAGNIAYDADENNDGEISIAEAEAVNNLKIENQNISSLAGIEHFVNLTSLYCRFNELSELNLSSLPSLFRLECDNNQLSELNITNSPLTRLICYNNELTDLDLNTMPLLESLNCSNNELTQLSMSATTNLESLSCNDNQLTQLNVDSLTSLWSLECNDNLLTQLNINALTNLNFVLCGNNQLNEIVINNLPNLDYFDCSGNFLTSIDLSGQNSFSLLNCSDNNFTTLDLSGLDTIWSLGASNNQLTSIILCDVMESVWVDGNFLTELDLSNIPMLDGVFCENNLLTTLDISNNPVIVNLYADNNEFTSLNLGAAENLYWPGDVFFDGNPNLSVVCTVEDKFDEVQSKLTEYGYSDCTISSYCSFEPNSEYFIVQGQTSFDLNSNGCDISDAFATNLEFNISSNDFYDSFYSNSQGEFDLYISSGSHTITPTLQNPDYFTISPTEIIVSFPTDTSPYTQDFCITPNGTHNDLEITLVPIDDARPGFDTDYKLIFKNRGTTPLSGSVELTFQDDLMDFVSASPSENSQAPNLLSWNFTDLTPFESRDIDITFNINTPTETPPVNGDDILAFTATLNTTETDETPEDNTFTLNQTVVNSYDPNDKTCLEGDFITPERIGDYVHYMIRFENTGTANAINVVVKDIIDTSKYDLSTLVPLHASHDFVARIKDNSQDHYIEFIFENINLPFDDANNDGYVAFKIKTLNTLVLGDTFENEAEIYFDFNFPIITDSAQTTVATLSTDDFELANNAILLYPNPTTHILNLDSKHAIKHIVIYDIFGRVIKEIAVIGSKTELNMSTESLASGSYFIKIKTGQGDSVQKFIKN
ncbi:T9SS type A sorting domain-containing protein [Psychroserpens sp. AS72]|uniref:T9SS type A sorting domain-containing protein n=1 Tax=Psychroserpens sp. AS72 TaxID=3135775 RepID=UPI0031724D96